MFHTIVYQTKVINKLRELGTEIPEEVLSWISPCSTEHLKGLLEYIYRYLKIAVENKSKLENATYLELA